MLSPHGGKTTRTQLEGGHRKPGRQVSPEPSRVCALTSDFQPPKLGEVALVVQTPIYGILLWQPELAETSLSAVSIPFFDEVSLQIFLPIFIAHLKKSSLFSYYILEILCIV